MEHGVYWGVVQGDRIVAAAGTHLVSDTHGVAAIGNVFTHPDLRGRGLGRAVTGAVLADLGSRGIRTVILNVSQSNAVAVRMYERLGFKRHCAFVEGAAQVREGL
jgi:predicted GNAT family acetyltransferase